MHSLVHENPSRMFSSISHEISKLDLVPNREGYDLWLGSPQGITFRVAPSSLSKVAFLIHMLTGFIGF